MLGAPRIVQLRAVPNGRASFGVNSTIVLLFDIRVNMGSVSVGTKVQIDNLLNCSAPYGNYANSFVVRLFTWSDQLLWEYRRRLHWYILHGCDPLVDPDH